LVEEGPSIPIVYALLSNSDSVHYVRINKSFNGNVPSYDMAFEPDSILFQELLDVNLYVFDENNNVIKTITFEKQYMKKDSLNHNGIVAFAVKNHYVYVGKGEILMDLNYSYKLEIKKDGIPITWATTGSLGDFRWSLPLENMMVELREDRPFATGWYAGKIAGIVKVFATIYYYEYNKTERMYFIREIQDSTEIVNASARGKGFFNLVDTLIKRIKETDSKDVEWRYIARAKIEYCVWSRDYTDYLLYNNTKDDTNYEYTTVYIATNIVGGYGVFGTKMSQTVNPVYFTSLTHKYFYDNYSGLKFRSPIFYQYLPDSLPYTK